MIYIAVCYFPLETLVYAQELLQDGQSPYAPWFANIVVFSQEADIILLGTWLHS